jgi:hypothetical protein
LEQKFTAFKLDRMTDGTESEDSERTGSEGVVLESIRARKRKFTPDGEGEEDGPERKRTTSPGTFAMSKEQDSMGAVSEV